MVVDRFSERGGVSLPSLTLLDRGVRVILPDAEIEEADIVEALAD